MFTYLVHKLIDIIIWIFKVIVYFFVSWGKLLLQILASLMSFNCETPDISREIMARRSNYRANDATGTARVLNVR